MSDVSVNDGVHMHEIVFAIKHHGSINHWTNISEKTTNSTSRETFTAFTSNRSPREQFVVDYAARPSSTNASRTMIS